MTLLVGVLCKDGAVIAADRQATHGALGMRTVGQSVTKISVIGTNALFASSGHHGLGQQLESVINAKYKEFQNHRYEKIITKVQEEMRKHVEPAMQTARMAMGVIGQAAQSDAVCGSILVACFQDGLKVVEITPIVAVEFLSPEMPFIALGSGKTSADPFLGFLQKVYWPDRQPTIGEGALAAYWTVRHAIDMKVDGVGFEVDVFIVKCPDGSTTPSAVKLTSAELAEHNDFIKAAEAALQAVAKPPPPPPAAAPPPTLPPN